MEWTEEMEARMVQIMQNGNDVDHYEEVEEDE